MPGEGFGAGAALGETALGGRCSELLAGSGGALIEKVVVLGPASESVARVVVSWLFDALTIDASVSHVAGSMAMSMLEQLLGPCVSKLPGAEIA